MLPLSYQKALRPHLSESQYLTLELLVMLIQSHRTVCLAQLANVFPQPIQYASRVRNLQRFLVLPQLSIKLLWFPILKQGLKQQWLGIRLNREQRRHRQKAQRLGSQYLLVILDRTQWREHNVLMVSLAWHQHALPLYWGFLPQLGNSSLRQQQQVLSPVLRLLRSYPVVVVADREFHSPKLANWLRHKRVDVISRQKKSAYLHLPFVEAQALKHLGFQPGTSEFFQQVAVGKEEPIGSFNLAVRWKRRYQDKSHRDPWYLLSTLSNFQQILALYRARWGIETMFRDYKSGGYRLEDSWVNPARLNSLLLLMTLAYSLTTCFGLSLHPLRTQAYLTRLKVAPRRYPYRSLFWVGLSATLWSDAMQQFHSWMLKLIALKPYKHLYFQRGFSALSLINSTL